MQVLIETHKKNGRLGHAYLFEGEHASVFPEITLFLDTIGIETKHNPDIWTGTYEQFGIEDARRITELQGSRPIAGNDRFFFIAVTSFSPEAQHALLKTFEDAREGIHYFLVVPRTEMLLPTLKSRFVFVETEGEMSEKKENLAKGFFKLSHAKRLSVVEPIIKAKDKIAAEDFLNALEVEAKVEHISDTAWYKQLYGTKRAIGFKGASIKLLLEGIALSLP
jgi:hypothetical protein